MRELWREVRAEVEELLRHPALAAVCTVVLLQALGIPVSRPLSVLREVKQITLAHAGQQAHRVKDHFKQRRNPLQVCADLLP